MRVSRAGAVTLRQFYLMRGSAARVLPLFAWVTVDMALWGFLSRYLNTLASPGFNFVPALLGAILLWDFFIRVMQGVTTAFLEDVWSRNFLNFFASPLSIPDYATGLVAASMVTSAVGLVTMVILAGAVFGLRFAAYGALLIPFLLVLFLFGIALGIVACSIVLRFGPAAEWFVWPIPALLAPFAAVYYPVSTLPRWMQAVSRTLPPSYVFESLRDILKGTRAPVMNLAIGGAVAIIDLIVAAWILSAVYRHAVRTGLIARYSAESVG